MPLPPHALPPSRPLLPYDKNPVYHQRPVAPIFLSAGVVMTPGSSQSVPLPVLQNPMGHDMELLEIRFELSSVLPSGNTIAVAYGGSIACQLAFGSYQLTNGAVPVWGFGKAENLEAENKIDTANVNEAYCSYAWRLPRPMFIPAGAAVVPTFVHTGFVNATINVRIGYSARSVFTKPKRAFLPWAANFTSDVFNPIENASTQQSSQQDLINNTPEVLNLQRFTARTLYIDASGFTSEASPENFGSQYLTMRMIDSHGRPIVRSYTPFRSVFSPLTRSWELEDLNAKLDPGAFYQVFLKKTASVVASANAQAQAFISMVGWREVAL